MVENGKLEWNANEIRKHIFSQIISDKVTEAEEEQRVSFHLFANLAQDCPRSFDSARRIS